MEDKTLYLTPEGADKLRTELKEALEQNKGLAERLAKLERERGNGAAIEGASVGKEEK